jgi:preflagellin peptidase FlaK
MLGIASYYDLKSREINDVVWIAFGASGTLLYPFDTSISFIMFVWMGFGFLAAIAFWRLCVFGIADMLAVIALSVIIPTYNNIPVPTFVLLISFVISSSYSVINNIYKNTKSLILEGCLFSEISESFYKKILAFFIIHKKARDERYVFVAESIVDGRHRFNFVHHPDTEQFENGRYVISAIPLMPFLTCGLVLFLVGITLLLQ